MIGVNQLALRDGLKVDVIEIDNGVQTVIQLTVEIEGGDRPACVVDSLSRFIW